MTIIKFLFMLSTLLLVSCFDNEDRFIGVFVETQKNRMPLFQEKEGKLAKPMFLEIKKKDGKFYLNNQRSNLKFSKQFLIEDKELRFGFDESINALVEYQQDAPYKYFIKLDKHLYKDINEEIELANNKTIME